MTVTEYVPLDRDPAGFDRVLQDILGRLRGPLATPPRRVQVSLVRRMTVSEVCRLSLVPASLVWLEVRIEAESEP